MGIHQALLSIKTTTNKQKLRNENASRRNTFMSIKTEKTYLSGQKSNDNGLVLFSGCFIESRVRKAGTMHDNRHMYSVAIHQILT